MCDNDSVFSLDNVVKKWAWGRFARLYRCPEIFLKSFYKLQISWSNVTTTQGDIAYYPLERNNKEATPSSGSGTANDDRATPLSQSGTANDDKAVNLPRSDTKNDLRTPTQRFATHETLVTKFANYSNQQQNHTLNVEQTVRSTCKVVMTKGVTHGGSCSFELKVPQDIVGAGATYQYQRNVTDSREQTFEHEVTWSGASQITVNPWTISEAMTVTTTSWVVRSFSLDKYFSGVVSVRIKPRLGKPLRQVQEDEIQKIVNSNKTGTEPSKKEQKEAYKATIKGECTFQYSVNHEIQVFHKTLNDPQSTKRRHFFRSL